MTDNSLRIAAHTSGFYRIDATDPEFLQYAPNFVHGPGFSLRRGDEHATREGWTFYNSAEDVKAALEVTDEMIDAALAEHGLRRA